MLSGVDILTVNETPLYKKEKMKLPGFKPFQRNRSNVQGGGIATCVRFNDYHNCVKVYESVGDNEFVITKHNQTL